MVKDPGYNAYMKKALLPKPKPKVPAPIPVPPPPKDQGFGSALSDQITRQSAARKQSAPPVGNTVPQPGVDKAAAAAQAKLVAQGNADRARIAAAKAKKK